MAGSIPSNSFFFIAYIFENERNVQKNRFFRLPKKFKLTYGESTFFTKNEGRIELIHLAFLKKRLKKILTKRENKLEYVRERVWFYVTPNFKIQQKSKNSRMGKGKGLIERHTVRIRKNVCLFEFHGLSPTILTRLLFKINKKLNVKLGFYIPEVNNYNFWSSKRKYTNYHEKYMIKF